jgi:hypothetical protein
MMLAAAAQKAAMQPTYRALVGWVGATMDAMIQGGRSPVVEAIRYAAEMPQQKHLNWQ